MWGFLLRLAPVSAAMGAALLLLGAVLYGLNRTMALPVQLAIGLGGSLLLAAITLRPDAVKRTFARYRFRYTSSAVIMTLAFLGILLLLNLLGQRHHQRLDLTESRDFSLSPQTIQILQNLTTPVNVVGFYQSGDPREKIVRDLLAEYQVHTPQLSAEFHDPDLEGRVVREHQPSNYGSLIFVNGSRRYETFGTDEQALTSALVRVTREGNKGVYFISGHGERRLDDYEAEGIGFLKAVLEREGYRVDPLNLAVLGQGIPEDAEVLVVVGPRQEYFERELALLQDWVVGGGSLFLMYDPGAPTPLAGELARWQITVEDDLIVDPANSLVVPSDQGEINLKDVLLLQQYPFHPITRDLANFRTYFPGARSIRIEPGDELTTPSAQPLVSSGLDSWGETDPGGLLELDPALDAPGPLHVGVAVENHEDHGRLVVFGDSDFISNRSLSEPVANVDLFVNCINWLAEDDDLISIRVKPRADRNLYLVPAQQTFALYTSVLFLPLLVAGAGVVVWWRRR
ncbi:MAG: GldG family protein [Anaerolineae bacterium]